jgi:hypothetical protein
MLFRLPLMIIFLLCAFTIINAQSQANTGNIEGRITDPNAASVPNVTVTTTTRFSDSHSAARARVPRTSFQKKPCRNFR